jgi:hypothetical protein
MGRFISVPRLLNDVEIIKKRHHRNQRKYGCNQVIRGFGKSFTNHNAPTFSERRVAAA